MISNFSDPNDSLEVFSSSASSMSEFFNPSGYRIVAHLVQIPNAKRVLSGHEFRGDERVLNLGCGEGTLTANVLRPPVPHGTVIRVDSSAQMIDMASRSLDLESANLWGSGDPLLSGS